MAPSHHLAQVNIGRIVAPLDDARLQGFVDGLDPVNAIADAVTRVRVAPPGRHGDATSFRLFDDDLLVINLSVWESVEALRAFAYGSDHVEYLRRRRDWFEPMSEAFLALWWVTAGTVPTPDEASTGSSTSARNGPTPEAFTVPPASSHPRAHPPAERGGQGDGSTGQPVVDAATMVAGHDLGDVGRIEPTPVGDLDGVDPDLARRWHRSSRRRRRSAAGPGPAPGGRRCRAARSASPRSPALRAPPGEHRPRDARRGRGSRPAPPSAPAHGSCARRDSSTRPSRSMTTDVHGALRTSRHRGPCSGHDGGRAAASSPASHGRPHSSQNAIADLHAPTMPARPTTPRTLSPTSSRPRRQTMFGSDRRVSPGARRWHPRGDRSARRQR